MRTGKGTVGMEKAEIRTTEVPVTAVPVRIPPAAPAMTIPQAVTVLLMETVSTATAIKGIPVTAVQTMVKVVMARTTAIPAVVQL